MAEDKKQIMNNITQLINENSEMTKRLEQATNMMRDMHSQNQTYKSQIAELEKSNKDLQEKLRNEQVKANSKFEEQERLKASGIIEDAQTIRDNTIQRANDKADEIVKNAEETAKVKSESIINKAKTEADYYKEKAESAQKTYELTNHKLEQLQDVIKDVLNGKTFVKSLEDVNKKTANVKDQIDNQQISASKNNDFNIPVDNLTDLMDNIQNEMNGLSNNQ